MNKIYKKVWSKLRGCFVAVSEALGSSQSHGKTAILIGGLTAIASTPGWALTHNDPENDLIIDYVFKIDQMTNNATIVNQGGDIEWIASADGSNYWNGTGNITGDGTGTLAFTGQIVDVSKPYVPHKANTMGSISRQKKVLIGYATEINGSITDVENLTIRSSDYFGGTKVTGDVSVGKLGIRDTQDQPYDGVLDEDNSLTGPNGVFGYLEVGGNLNADTVNLDIIPVLADEGFEPDLENRAEGLRVKGDMAIAGNFNSFGDGWFEGASVIAGTLNHAFIYEGLELADVQEGWDDMSKLFLDFNSLEAGNIQNGGTIVANSVRATNFVNEGSFTTENFHVLGAANNTGSLSISGTLTFGQDSVLESSGTVTTSLDNVFVGVNPTADSLHVINFSATLPEEIHTVTTELFRKYVPGEVADALAEHASFTGGKVVVTGVNLTNTQVADLTQAFKEKLFLPNSSHQECFL